MTDMPATENSESKSQADELKGLIATLHDTEQRIAVLTKGEVDAVASSEGQTYLLRQAQEQLRTDAAARNADILNALPANVALLNADGLIIAVNTAWRTFARKNGYTAGRNGVASNYFDICDDVIGTDQNDAQLAAAGIRSVIEGTAARYAQEYSGASPSESRWFQLVVAPIEGDRPGGAVVMHMDISSQRHAEEESAELQRRFADLLMNMELASVMLDTQGRITFCNDHFLRLTGWSNEETIGNDWFEQFIPPTDEESKSAFSHLLASGRDSSTGLGTGRSESAILTRTGETRLMRWSNSLQCSPSGEMLGTASIGEDITEQRLAEIQLRNLNRVRMVLSGINTLIVRVNDRDDLYQGACRIAIADGGFLIAMLVVVDLQRGEMRVAASAGKDEALLAEINRLLVDHARAASSLAAMAIRERRVIVVNDCSTDHRLTLRKAYSRSGVRSLAIFPLLSAGEAVGAFVLYSDEVDFFLGDELALLNELTDDIAFAMDHIEKSDRLAYLALYDPLTGLPNTQLFEDQLDRCIVSARKDGEQVCVIVLDLEGFTDVNRTYGRAIGDDLLRAVSARLLRDLTGPFALGRTGADTFTIASRSATTQESDHLRDAAIEALREAFVLEDQAIRISGQSGIAVFPDDGNDAKTLLLNAESALKRAKASKQSYVYSSHELNALAAERRTLESELRDALAGNQFRAHYQPRADMARGEIVGAEALIRWQHPRRGLLAPGEFIELAEETGLIVQIGTWMLQTVCAQQAAWLAAGLRAVPVAVNVSAVQFEQGDLLQVIRDALQSNALDARMLHIELTESAVMRDPDAALAVLDVVRELGVELALDDFGTGHSSLAILKRFPFSMVKIDRGFVTQITSNVEDAAIATAIIAMARGLRLRSVAEGVETQGQFNYLRAKGCDEVQGYLFSRPVPTEAFEEILRVGMRLTLPDREDASRPTLLVVDDEPEVRASLKRLLRQDGYRVLGAGNGKEALELLALNSAQVVIAARRLPAMSGIEFLDKVAGLYPTMARLMLSDEQDLESNTEGASQETSFQFIAKPWDDAVLRQAVRDAFATAAPEPLGR